MCSCPLPQNNTLQWPITTKLTHMEKKHHKHSKKSKRPKCINIILMHFFTQSLIVGFCQWTTQSPERKAGTIVLWSQVSVCWVNVERGMKEWSLMVGWCGYKCHDVVFNNTWYQPHVPVPHVCEEQSPMYQSLCVVAWSASHLVLGCSAHLGHCAKGVGKEEWLWGWCHCTATISPMPGSTQHCVPCSTLHLLFTIKFVGFWQWTSWQYTSHTVSSEREVGTVVLWP